MPTASSVIIIDKTTIQTMAGELIAGLIDDEKAERLFDKYGVDRLD